MKGNMLFTPVILFIFLTSQAFCAQQESYHKLSLEQAIDIALEKNRDIINADKETNKADYQIIEAASAAFPQISGLWDYEKNLKPQVFVISFPDSEGVMQKNHLKVGTDHRMYLGASLTQPIYVGGKVGTALKAAKIYKNVSNEILSAVKQNVVAGVVHSFNGVLLSREINKIAFESLSQAENHLKNVRNLYNVGKATEYDLLRSRVNVANLKPNVIDAENNVQISLLRLKEIMGLDPDTPLDIIGSFSEPDTTLFAYANKKVAFSNRPDLKASKFTVELQDKVIKIVKGDFLPTLTFGTTFAYTGNFDLFKYDVQDWSPFWLANFTLSFPIFSGFKNYSKYKQAKVDYFKAKTDYRKLRDVAVIEVNEAVMNLRKTIEQIESQRLNVEEAERAVRLAESLYTNGRATQLEVLDAQLAFEVAKTNMVNYLYEGKVAEVTLKKNLGLIDIDTKERE